MGYGETIHKQVSELDKKVNKLLKQNETLKKCPECNNYIDIAEKTVCSCRRSEWKDGKWNRLPESKEPEKKELENDDDF